MAAQRSSASKRQRDIDKRSRAAEKRDRRQRKGDPSTDDRRPTGRGCRRRRPSRQRCHPRADGTVQREFDAEIIDFETYDARKAELLSHIQI